MMSTVDFRELALHLLGLDMGEQVVSDEELGQRASMLENAFTMWDEQHKLLEQPYVSISSSGCVYAGPYVPFTVRGIFGTGGY